MTNQLWQPPVDSAAARYSIFLIRYRTFAFVGFCMAAMFDGALSAQGAAQETRILAAFAMAMAATMWCTVDASSRGDYYPHSLRWVTMVTWPVALPVYLVQTRKGRGVLLTAFGFVAMIAMEVLGYLGGVLLPRGAR